MVRIRAYMDTDVAVETDWVNANGEGKEEEEEDKNGKLHPFYRHLRFFRTSSALPYVPQRMSTEEKLFHSQLVPAVYFLPHIAVLISISA